MIDFETEKICLNQIVSNKRESFFVEDNIIIPDIKPDILSTIDSSGEIYIYKKEIINGKLKIDGGIYTDIMYIADNEQSDIRGLHAVVDFSKNIEIENLNQDTDFECNLEIKNIECKVLNGRKLNIKIDTNADIKLCSNSQKEFVRNIKDEEGIQMISNSMVINALKGKGETVALAKDTITIDERLADILNSEITIKNRDIKISYNKVLTKADVNVEILYLTEEGKINSTVAQIPIMGFIDIPNISDKEICNSNYEIRNINIKPNDIEDHSIYIEIEFLIACSAYENRNIDLIQDLYSPEEEIEISQENVNLMRNKNIVKSECNIQEKIDISKINSDKIYNIRVYPNIIKENVLNKEITYEGELNLKIFYESNVTNRLEVKVQPIAFTHKINSDEIEKDYCANTYIEIDSKDFICMPDNTLDVRINMNFIADIYKKDNISIINKIDIKDKVEKNKINSLVIYFVKEGDSLWKIAKKFKSTVDEIASINNIENKNKLNIGDQLYIPKYMYNRIS